MKGNRARQVFENKYLFAAIILFRLFSIIKTNFVCNLDATFESITGVQENFFIPAGHDVSDNSILAIVGMLVGLLLNDTPTRIRI